MNDSRVSRRELIEFLNNSEMRYPVENWTAGKMNIWPLVKIDLFSRLVVKERGESNQPKEKKVGVGRFGAIVNTIKSLFYYFLFKFKSHTPNIPYFFSDSRSHRLWFEGRFVNRYFSPIKDQIYNLRNSSPSLTINDDSGDCSIYPDDENILFIKKLLDGAGLLRKLKYEKPTLDAQNFDGFIGEVKASFPVLGVDSTYDKVLLSKVFHIYVISDIIDLLILKYNPKVIFELCYYSALRLGINYSAYKSNIPTIEIQHGGLGIDHVAYSGWGKIPGAGYNLLPRVFWVWDKNSEQIINQWGRNSSFHKTVLGGNPWVMFSMNHKRVYDFPENKKIILFTLQDSLVDNYIYEAIENSPEEYEWWIREHPRFPMVGTAIKEGLKKRDITKPVNFKQANDYPLPILLNHCVVHISGSSGSILEASLLGVPSLIIDEIGERYYQNLILTGGAFPLRPKTASNLMDLIKELSLNKSDRPVWSEDKKNLKVLDEII